MSVPGLITLVDGGITGDAPWWQLNNPNAYYFEGDHKRTYVTWQQKQEGSSLYRTMVCAYDHETGEVLGPVTVFNHGSDADNHGVGAIWVDPDGYIWVFGGSHNTYGKYSRTVWPEDIEDWKDPPYTWHSAATYPNLLMIGNYLYVFFRGGNDLVFRKIDYRTPSQENWSTTKTIVDCGSGYLAYIGHAVVDALGTIHLQWTIFEQAPYKRLNIYYLMSEDGGDTWKKRDGTVVTLPLKQHEGDLVFDSQGVMTSAYRIVVDPDGEPTLYFAYDPAGTGYWPYYPYYARFIDGAWKSFKFPDEGGSPGSTAFYSLSVDDYDILRGSSTEGLRKYVSRKGLNSTDCIVKERIISESTMSPKRVENSDGDTAKFVLLQGPKEDYSIYLYGNYHPTHIQDPVKTLIDLLRDNIEVYDDQVQLIPVLVSERMKGRSAFKDYNVQVSVESLRGDADVFDMGAHSLENVMWAEITVSILDRRNAGYTPERVKWDTVQEIDRLLYASLIDPSTEIKYCLLHGWGDDDRPEDKILRKRCVVELTWYKDRS